MRAILGLMVAGLAVGQGPAVPMPHPAFPGVGDSALGAKVAALLADPGVARAHWGIAVTALDGTPLFGVDEGKFFRPASTNKLFTTAAAMSLLGPNSAQTTEVMAYTDRSDPSVLKEVTLNGVGDANLSGVVLPFKPGQTAGDPLKVIDDLAAQIAAKGIRRVDGPIVGSDARWPWEPYGESWAYDDVLWGYGAPVSALAVNDNEIKLVVTPGARVHEPAQAKLLPDVGYYELHVEAKTIAAGSKSTIHIEHAPGTHVVTISGEIALGGTDQEELGVDDPALFAADALKSRLLAHGIKVEDAPLARHTPNVRESNFSEEGRVLVDDLPRKPVLSYPRVVEMCNDECPHVVASHISPTLSQDVVFTLKVSQNLHAEMMLRRLGEAYGTGGTFVQGARVVRQFLVNAGIDGEDFNFYDGSGLSAKDIVTPRAETGLLVFAATQPWFPVWKFGLPVAGVDGTLGSRYKESPLKGHVFAKTGTLGESRALAGYMDCASGRQVVFSIMVDDHAPGTSADRVVMDKIVAAIAEME